MVVHAACRRTAGVAAALFLTGVLWGAIPAGGISPQAEASDFQLQLAQAEAPAAETPPATPAVPAPATEPPLPNATAPPALPTSAELTAQRQAILQDTNLDEATRMLLDQHFTKSIEHAQAIEANERQISQLQQELDTAPQRVGELQERINSHAANPATQLSARGLSLEEIAARQKEAETQLASARERLQRITAEIERRAARRPQLAEIRGQTQQALTEAQSQFQAANPEGELPVLTEARRLRLRLRLYRLQRELVLLDLEARTYEATSRYWTLERDAADLAQRDADRVAQFWRQAFAESRRIQAEQEALEARRALARSHDSVRKEAERNSELAEENTSLTQSLRQAQLELERVKVSLEEREEELRSLRERAEAAEFSPAVGVLLRNRRLALPDPDEIRLSIQQRQAQITALNLKLMEWQADRKPLVDLTAASESIIANLQTIPDTISSEDLLEQVRELLSIRLKLISDLLENGSSKLDLLVTLDSQEKRLLAAVQEESQWLAEHVLWVRSAGLFGTQTKYFVAAMNTLLDPVAWAQALESLEQNVRQDPAPWFVILLGLGGLLAFRKRLKKRLRCIGEAAQRPNCMSFWPTLEALIATLLLALPLPLLVWCIGWRMLIVGRGDTLLSAIGHAFEITSFVWLGLELLRQVAAPYGLGQSHFGWQSKSLSNLRVAIRGLSMALLPLLSIVVFTEYFGDSDLASTIGRAAYLPAMVSLALTVFYLLPRTTAAGQSVENDQNEAWIWRTQWIWSRLLMVAPILLAGLSLLGYHYTAIQLSIRTGIMLGSIWLLVILMALLSRWLLVTYRKLAILRAREKRQQLLQANQTDTPLAGSTETSELRLTDVNLQTRNLIRLAGTIGLLVIVFVIWVDVLPAFGILRKVPVGWNNGLAGLNEDGSPIPVTLADLLTGALIASLTWAASRNLPGLMEIVLLQKLPLDAGARYAASTVSKYLIVISGFVLGFQSIGIGWSSVQWLVAAMTVGLGFGLQEIFANFVSGIILLFERPMRVGDTVTIGGTTGTVARIQTRATTIVDWDNRELIIPNRNFVTGEFVNWTLSSQTVRLVIRVGIAYGSDTRLATRVLYQLAKDHPLVLLEPEPVVVFTTFGQSTLDFELRVFTNGMLNLRKLRHDLHLAIDDAFREQRIEIAFPQQDLHIRSLPEELLSRNNRRAEEAA
jgi:potassium efflux system protein